MPESKFKKKLKEYLKSIGAYYAMIPGGAFGTNGSSDLVVCYKGLFISVEAKADGGIQSDWQKLRQRQVEKAGGKYIVVRTIGDMEDFISSLEPRE